MRMPSLLKRALDSILFVVLLSSGQFADASTITYVTPGGSKTSDGAVNGEADFTVSAGALTLLLQNFQKNPTGDAQLISGITFKVSGATGVVSLTSSNGFDSNINVNSPSNKNFDSTKPNGYYHLATVSPLGHWAASGAIGTIDLTTLSGGKPNELIIGPDSLGQLDGSGVFGNANPSISQHDPTVIGFGTFMFAVAGITAKSSISDVTFQFGTSGTDITGQPGGSIPASTPEPTSVALMGMGMLGMAAYSWRRRKSNK